MKNRMWFSLAALLVISGTLLLVHQPTQADRQTPYERLSSASGPVFLPAVSEWYVISKKTAQPPTEANYFAEGIRCFAPKPMRAAYNSDPLFAQVFDGTGKTIAIINTIRSATIATDLNLFATPFGL